MKKQTWRVISIDPETKKEFIATFDNEEDCKKCIKRNNLNPFTTAWGTNCLGESLEELTKQVLEEIRYKLFN